MEIVTACVTAIVEDVVKSTGRQVGYIFRFKSIIEDLKEEAECLRSAQDDMQHRVDRAIKDTDEIEKKVEKWLKDVTDVVADAEDLDKQAREKKTCLNGLCPNLIWRYQMARRAQKKKSIMLTLTYGGKFDNFLTPKDFMLFESTAKSFNLIIEALKDDKTNVVGLYGMGGVGKTTLAKAVVKKAKEEKIFNEVVMVAVSQTPNIRGIQGQLADFLNLKLQEESREGIAERLHMRLKNEKKILIILDDIWEKIDLAVIGIPVDDHHKDCKIFLTTRQKQVCIVMGCQSRIPLDVLNKDEGLVLFKRHADFVLPTKLLRYDIRVNDYAVASYPKSRLLTIRGIEATSLVAFKALYEKVEYLELIGIKGCCQNMVSSIDETGLNELKRLSLSYFDELECIIDTTHQQDVPSTAFSNLVHLSLKSVGLREICSGGRPPGGFLENLETLEIRDCDNMSCLFPSRVLIQRLRKLKKVTVKVCGELEDVFQLEGLSYAKENPFLLSSLESLHLSWLHNLRYIWKGPTQQVSLQSLTVVEVESCNKLRYLFTLSLARSLLQLEQLTVKNCGSLEHIVEIKEAEENVGGGGGNDVMFPRLRKLQLERLENFINFYSENSSLNLRTAKEGLRHGLPNLEELHINWSGLQVLFYLEGLEQELAFPSLKVLELCYLEELEWLCKGPTHLLSLPNLKKLEVSYCDSLRHMFSPSLARNFMQLEELFIENCKELEYIVSIKAEENVGGGGGNDVMLPKLRILRLSGLENFIDFYSENLSLNVQTTKKQLRGLRHGFPNLEELFISRCGGVQVVFQLEDLEQELSFPSLKVLELNYLKELECLCKGPTHLLSLPNLKKLEARGCNRLRHMFSPSLARNLLQLEELNIEDCGELEYIVSIKAEENVGGRGGNDVMLPKLRILKLDGIENFIDFCSENSSLNVQTTKKQLRGLRHGFPNLEELFISRCGGVQVVFQLEDLEQELSFPSLKVLELNYLKELECLCKGPTHLLSLPNLKKLEARGCNRLRHMFSPSLARNLLQLEELNIEDCGELEYIVSIKAEENVGGRGGNDVMLPKLRILKLDGIENFIDFCSENSSLNVQTTKKQLRGLRHGFPNLEELFISRCGGVQVVFQLEDLEQELSFPSLKVLELNYLKELECLCKGPTHLLSLPNLKKLEARGCNRLRHMFSPSLARNLLQLEELNIEDCGELEQIFIEDETLSEIKYFTHLQSPLPFPNLICWYDKLEKISIEKNNQTLLKDHLQWSLLFPNLSRIHISSCYKLKSMFMVSITHLLSLQNLTTLILDNCHGLTHLFSSTTLVRNLLRLESIDINDCGELEQIIVEDHTENDHVQFGLFPNLSFISVKGCGKLKTLFPAVTIARSGLQNLKTIRVENSFQLEELFGHKDEADMTSHKEMVLPQLEKLTLRELASLVNFCPVGYHFIFPSLSELFVKECPKITTRFSVDQSRFVHAEAEVLTLTNVDVVVVDKR
ncbi:hypothetical protein LWI29_022924 [Acer saccharum]|uniref:AAA+ ATPase domain-containing protein n=1 Tax=Acer saccharum TaxID=4024 RepID=A0AA39T1Y1_ACESA|nr:hypothetical protein LWI29_022924 [Acer saccharum]